MAANEFDIEYAPEVIDHLLAIDRKYHSLIRRAIYEQLRSAPEEETHNRKPLQRPVSLQATWELRFGPANRFRVYYYVDAIRRVVRVSAVGVKERNRLFIGGEEFVL
jgi:mRNA-degrading endonuclease RelE of RelBE toxin-antitoxin system